MKINLKMKDKKEIAFWKEAKKKIERLYGGHHCKPIDRDYRCAGCWSGIAISWIDAHLDLIQEKSKKLK